MTSGRFLVIAVSAILVLCSCTRKTDSGSKIRVKLPNAGVAQKSDVSAQNSADWNTNLNPTGVGQINCFAVFVGGPEPFLDFNKCTDAQGVEKFRFGPTAMFFPAGSTIELDVPSGDDRKIIVAGGVAQNGACQQIPFTAAPDFANMSEPFIVAEQTLDLLPGDNIINLTATLNTNNKFHECDFFSPGGGGGPPPPPPGSNRYVLGQNDLFENLSLKLGFNKPRYFATDGTKFAVADQDNHRVLIWNSTPASDNQPPDVVLGQPHFSEADAANGGISAFSLKKPRGILMIAGKLIVADADHHRVLIWNTIPTNNFAPADVVLGQPGFATGISNNGGVSAQSLFFPRALTTDGTKLFVSDSDNNRVLIWNTIPTTNHAAADVVVGQTNFTNQAAVLSATGLDSPEGLKIIGGKLVIADKLHNRVMIWNTVPTANGATADVVLGQPGFGSSTINNGGLSASSMDAPDFITTDGTKLFMSDSGNNRILIWNTVPGTNNTNSDTVLGQPNFTTNTVNNGGINNNTLNNPSGMIVVGGSFFAADRGNHRVLKWNLVPTANQAAADIVLGQQGFFNNSINHGTINASRMVDPHQMASDNGFFAVADQALHRVLIWNGLPLTTAEPAAVVVGQPDFSSTLPDNGSPPQAIEDPKGVAIVGGKFLVSDSSNNRVLIWNSVPTANHAVADHALGQPNTNSTLPNNGGVGAATMDNPSDVFSDGTRLYVADRDNNRILIWNSMPTATGQAADIVLGQPNFTTTTQNTGGIATGMNKPRGIYSDGTRLVISDSNNHRVLFWTSIPTTNGQLPDFVLGQPNFTTNNPNQGGISAATVNLPRSTFIHDGKFYLADALNNRILVWNSLPTGNGQPADSVIGQLSTTSNVKGIGPEFFHGIRFIFGLGDSLAFGDTKNGRVLVEPNP